MPKEVEYCLEVYDEYAGDVQRVEMTRSEYAALKAHLAAMRGYGFGDFAAQISKVATSGPDGYGVKHDEQQAAAQLHIARDFYRHCPALVVFESPEFDEYI